MALQETHRLDFKQSWQDDHLKTLCAFSNTEGGTIQLGKNDEGQPVSLNDTKKLLESLPGKIIQKLGVYPQVDLVEEAGQAIIHITVEASPLPVSYHGKYYKRVGSTNQELKGQSLATFLLDRGAKGWDSQLEVTASLDDIETSTVETFRRLSAPRIPFIHTEEDLLTLLQKLNLAEGKHLKRAAVLLFGKNPQRFYPQSYIKVGLFASDADLLSDDVIQGNLFEQVERTLEVLKSKHLIPKIYYEQWLRKQKLEYPENALREAVINSVVHKDYIGPPVQISVYDDKLMVWNEGLLPSTITIEDLKKKHPSRPRNQLLSEIFYKAGYIEAWGRGTVTITQSCRQEGLPEPQFREAFGGLELTFRREYFTQEQLAEANLNERQIKVLRHMQETRQAMTNSEYQDLAGTTKKTATRDLQDLVEKRMVINLGKSGTSARYILK
ncbi:MAG: ATP-binding protein [Cyclobacteriaceae bacterium]